MKKKMDSQFIGCGGEFSVASELLFRGFNANIMSVDTGIDIVATRDDKVFLIQVKTSRTYKILNFRYDVRMKSLLRFNSGNVFYIFVMRHDSKSDYLILPANVVERKINENAIKTAEKYDKYRVDIRLVDSDSGAKVYLGNRNHEMSYYLNKWELIK